MFDLAVEVFCLLFGFQTHTHTHTHTERERERLCVCERLEMKFSVLRGNYSVKISREIFASNVCNPEDGGNRLTVCPFIFIYRLGEICIYVGYLCLSIFSRYGGPPHWGLPSGPCKPETSVTMTFHTPRTLPGLFVHPSLGSAFFVERSYFALVLSLGQGAYPQETVSLQVRVGGVGIYPGFSCTPGLPRTTYDFCLFAGVQEMGCFGNVQLPCYTPTWL